MLEDEKDFFSADIIMLPPDDPNCSDQDSGPEDGEGIIDNLSKTLLNSNAEALISNIEAGKEMLQKEEIDMQIQTPLKKRVKKSISIERNWKKSDILNVEPIPVFSENREFENSSPHTLFKLFFDDEIIKFITDMSNLYAKDLKRISVNRNVENEIKFDGKDHFIGKISDGRKRCKLCHKKVSKKCLKCDVALHLECFEHFHRK
ncbi:hypothetical protein HELRODRAFT_169050 [Helobdella robusta]|uniref:Uncharacterized protein n=1 Tax=Helobdella robusta TaxID=6412 RepID=T1F1B6_HELRO|nr:hypothetical protein HELRODRAFT_169050 [Helobdella robusta]ESO09110.1 hypothetical protein HELRODRAFT_169050 [Helobdella robusta]